METFADLIESLSLTMDEKTTVGRLSSFFSDVTNNREKQDALQLLLGIYPKKCISTRQLKLHTTELTGISGWMIERCIHEIGNFLKMLSLLLNSDIDARSQISLADVMQSIRELHGKKESEVLQFIRTEVPGFQDTSKLLILQLLCGQFKTPCSHLQIFIALSPILGIDHNLLNLRFHLTSPGLRFEINQLEKPLKDEQKLLPVWQISNFSSANALSTFENLDSWQVFGVKYGQKALLKKYGDAVILWSDDQCIISEEYPEIIHRASSFADDFTIWGQITGSDERKDGSFFEIWHIDASEPARDSVINFEVKAPCYLPEQIPWSNFDELKQVHARCHAEGFSGILLKKVENVPNFVFWKADNYAIHAILMYVEMSPLSTSEITSVTFGLFDQNNLLPIGKITFENEDPRLEQIATFVKENTIERFGPVRTVKPARVYELHFEAARSAPKRKSGLMLSNLTMHQMISESPSDAHDMNFLRKLISSWDDLPDER